MKKIITIVCVLAMLSNFVVVKGAPTEQLRKKKKKKSEVCTVVECHEKLSPATHKRVLHLNARLTKLAEKQLLICNNAGQANAFMRYSSFLYKTDQFVTVDIRYSNQKEFYTDKSTTPKYLIGIYTDEARFEVHYDSFTKLYKVKYSYRDFSIKNRPSPETMENELCSAIAALEKNPKLTLSNY